MNLKKMARANGKMTWKYQKKRKMAKNHFSRAESGSRGVFLAYMEKTCDVAGMAILAKKIGGKSA